VAFDEELGYRLREILLAEEGLSEQPMFGGLAFLIHDNLAVSASSQGGLLLREDPAHTETLLARPFAHPFIMREREMNGWIRVDEEGIRTKRNLRRWSSLGVTYAQSLPPKR
jgi:hypothetical protein